jgi:hypothetical protein
MRAFEQKPKPAFLQTARAAVPPARSARLTEPNDRRDAAPCTGLDFGRVPIHPLAYHDDLLGAAQSNEETKRAVGEAVADDAEQLSSAPKIDQLNVITSRTGAFSDFPVAKGIDLNVPGPFNDTKTTGSCVNVHQMQFHLSRGDPSEVKLIRKVVRVAKAGGRTDEKGEKDKPADDGPSAGSVIRPEKSSSVVVADAPGFIGKGDPEKTRGSFPVSYDADFQLFATDRVQPRILAKLEYGVHIAKQSFGDSAPKNEITETSRKLF